MSTGAAKFNQITEKIIGCAFTVSNTLGIGFLEKVYENALAHEIKKSVLKVVQQYPMEVGYDGVIVGEYFADLLVEELVLVEIKTVRAVDSAHLAQCMNYLKASDNRICHLLNFHNPKLEVKRIVNHFPDV